MYILISENIRVIVVMKIWDEINNTNSNNHDNGFHYKKNNNSNKEVLITIAVIILACRRNSMQNKETLTHRRNWSVIENLRNNYQKKKITVGCITRFIDF